MCNRRPKSNPGIQGKDENNLKSLWVEINRITKKIKNFIVAIIIPVNTSAVYIFIIRLYLEIK
jgi:hypothetical protein